MGNGGPWALPLWAKWAFWIPFFTFFIAENKSFFSRLKFIWQSDGSGREVDFSVVIPTYNPGENLQKAVDSVLAQGIQARDFVFADASSTDGALEALNAGDVPVSTVTSELGRGGQIKAGVEAAKGNWVVILHSDVILPADAFQTISEAIEKNVSLIGGSLGQRFTNQSPGLFLIENMNEFRAVLMGTSFGDQTQFFHRETALQKEVLTDQPLMEDVEMSDRLGLVGDVVYLGHEAKVSAQKWIKGNFWKRFFTIIEFCVHYRLLAFSRQRRSELSKKFYDRYYRAK